MDFSDKKIQKIIGVYFGAVVVAAVLIATLGTGDLLRGPREALAGLLPFNVSAEEDSGTDAEESDEPQTAQRESEASEVGENGTASETSTSGVAPSPTGLNSPGQTAPGMPGLPTAPGVPAGSVPGLPGGPAISPGNNPNPQPLPLPVPVRPPSVLPSVPSAPALAPVTIQPTKTPSVPLLLQITTGLRL